MTGAGDAERRTPLWRRIVTWCIGLLLVSSVIALVTLISVAQITTEGEAKRALRHALAGLTEIDAFLDERYGPLRERASSSEEPLRVPGYPIDVTFTRQEVAGSTRQSFRELLLDRSVDRVYEDGPDALSQASGSDAGIFSAQGALDQSLNIFGDDAHTGALVALAVTTAVAVGLAGALAVVTPQGALLGIGVCLLAGAGLALAASGLSYAGVALGDADHYLYRQFEELVRGLLWAPLRTGIVLAGLGLVITVTALVLGRGRRRVVAAP